MAFATTLVAQDNDTGGASFQDGFLDVNDEYQLKMVVIEQITTQSHHHHQCWGIPSGSGSRGERFAGFRVSK